MSATFKFPLSLTENTSASGFRVQARRQCQAVVEERVQIQKVQESHAKSHAQFSLKDCTACRRAGPAACHCELDAVPPATYTWPLEAAAAMTACNPLPVTNSYLQHDITNDINTSCALRQSSNTTVCKYGFRHRSVRLSKATTQCM